MGELIFIGLGLYDEKDISINGLEAARGCEQIFAEFYTAKLTGTTVSKLEEMMGKTIEILDRERFEAGDEIISAARDKKVAVLVPGDPMTATTHVSLRLRAKREGMDTRIIPGASIITSAAGLLGLHIYKFGKTASIPYPHKNYFPTSSYDVISENMISGLHSLVLLDIDEHAERYMRADEALKLLLKMEEGKKEGVFGDDTLVCVLGGVGSSDPFVKAGRLKDLADGDFGEGLHCLIIPGKLHFLESEALVEFAGAPSGILEEK